MQACKNIAQRSINAENNFINSVMEQFNFSQNEAERILSVYKKYKLVKIDYVTGQFNLKDGRFWDRYPMENALK